MQLWGELKVISFCTTKEKQKEREVFCDCVERLEKMEAVEEKTREDMRE